MGMRISSHSISTMELSQPPAQHQNPLHQLSQGSAQQSFHIPDEIQVPRTEIRWDFLLCFATASITLSAERCLNVNCWIRFIFCKYYCSSMNFGINESEAGEAGI